MKGDWGILSQSLTENIQDVKKPEAVDRPEIWHSTLVVGNRLSICSSDHLHLLAADLALYRFYFKHKQWLIGFLTVLTDKEYLYFNDYLLNSRFIPKLH